MKLKVVAGALIAGLMFAGAAVAQEKSALHEVWQKSAQSAQDVPAWVKNLAAKTTVADDGKEQSHELVIRPNGRHSIDKSVYTMFDICPQTFCDKEFLQILVDSKVQNSWGAYKDESGKVTLINEPQGKIKEVLETGVANFPHKNMDARTNWKKN